MDKENLLVFGSEQLKQDYIDRTLVELNVEPQNEETTYLPPDGFNGFNKVIVSGNKLQERVVVTPSNETQVITPSDDNYGLSEVVITPIPIDTNAIIEKLNVIATSVNANIDDTDITINENVDESEQNVSEKIDELFINLTQSDITSNDIREGKEVFANGTKIIGTMNLAKEMLEQSVDKKYLFYNRTNLAKQLEKLPSDYDFTVIGNFGSMFYGCSTLVKFPFVLKFDTNTSGVDNREYGNIFNGCSNLEEIEIEILQGRCSIVQLFQNCSKLKKITFTNPNQEYWSIQQAFQNCYELEKIEGSIKLGTSNYTNYNNAFYNCRNLKNVIFSNIPVNLQIGNGVTWGHLLTLESLLSACQACYKSTSKYTLTVGSANLQKLANVYVKITNTTSNYLPFEVCESTDEGAMLIVDYMALKQWSLA